MQLTKEEVDKIFKDGISLIALYRHVYPRWEEIENISGFPVAGKELHEYLTQLFVDDNQFFTWVNRGFSRNTEFDPWELSLHRCKITYK